MIACAYGQDDVTVVMAGKITANHAAELALIADALVNYFCYRRINIELRSARMTAEVAVQIKHVLQRLESRSIELSVVRFGKYGRNSALLTGEHVPSQTARRQIGFGSAMTQRPLNKGTIR